MIKSFSYLKENEHISLIIAVRKSLEKLLMTIELGTIGFRAQGPNH